MNVAMREAVNDGRSWEKTAGSRIAHTSVERLGSESGGSRERDNCRERRASGLRPSRAS